MSECFDVISARGAYRIFLDTPRESLVEICQRANTFVVMDAAIRRAVPWLRRVRTDFTTGGEDAKSLGEVARLAEAMHQAGANRSFCAIAVGGGTVQDLVGFTSAVYMRGIKWIYIPTTLLSMVDSCIGGKTSINASEVKNLLGLYTNPVQVHICLELLETLSTSQVVSGLLEARKILYASGQAVPIEGELVGAGGTLAEDRRSMRTLIKSSLLAKKQFIELDEFDQGQRRLLNFGHTFGHALESASSMSITHGYAVGLGILMAVELSSALAFSTSDTRELRALRHDVLQLLRHDAKSLAAFLSVSPERVVELVKSDKKHTPKEMEFILIDRQGKLVRHRLRPTSTTEALVRNAIRTVQLRLNPQREKTHEYH